MQGPLFASSGCHSEGRGDHKSEDTLRCFIKGRSEWDFPEGLSPHRAIFKPFTF